jgi:hypothetical protein
MNKYHWALIIISIINMLISIQKDAAEKEYPFINILSDILSSAFIIILIYLSSIK